MLTNWILLLLATNMHEPFPEVYVRIVQSLDNSLLVFRSQNNVDEDV